MEDRTKESYESEIEELKTKLNQYHCDAIQELKPNQKIEKYLNLLKDILNLNNWETTLIEEPALETDAACKLIYNDYAAIIKLNANMSREEKEKSLIHELLHCIHRDELDIASECIEGEYQNELYVRFHERSIEQMAKTIHWLIGQCEIN